MSSFTLDQFRAVLDHLDAEERVDQLRYFRVLNDLGAEVIPELNLRLQRVSAPRAFRLLVFESAFYYPWSGWVPLLSRALRREADPELFGLGILALGSIGDAGAVAALRELSQHSSQPGFQEKVAGVLADADPTLAWDHHLERLLEGSVNPAVANEGARQLGQLLDPTKLASLRTVLTHPDLLVFRHSVRLLARVPSAEAGAFLLGYLWECHQGILEGRAFKETLAALRSLGVEAVQARVVAGFSDTFAASETESLGLLRDGIGPSTLRVAQDLRQRAQSLSDRWLADILVASVEAKGARLQALFSEAGEELTQRFRRLAFALDAGAEGLVERVQGRQLSAEEVLPMLEASLRLQTGHEGVARALAALAPAQDEDLTELLLRLPDSTGRLAALETLGERGEEALGPVLLRACRDPISDIAQRAMLHLGKLPGADSVARSLLLGDRLEDIQLGIRFVGLHSLKNLAPELLNLVRAATREELAVEALESLGHSGAVEMAAELLELLHSGQSPRMQLALGQALRDLGDVESTRLLCARAEALRSPLLHAVALEAVIRMQHELGVETLQRVPGLVSAAWEGWHPWASRLRVVLALQGLHLEDRQLWAKLLARIQAGIAESKTAGGWSGPDRAKVQAVARELAARATA